MLVYRYDEDTKAYLGPEEAFLDPLETERKGREVYLLPAGCTFDAPPDDREGFYLRRVGETWEYTEIPGFEPEPEPVPPTVEEQLERLTRLIQEHMDDVVATKGYDDINTACTYSVSENPTFQAEGKACVKWRDAVWSRWFAITRDVKAGNAVVPTLEDAIASLPKIEW